VRISGTVRTTLDEGAGQKAEFLAKVELFKHLDKDTLEKLATRVHLVSLPAGHVLRENEPTDGLYIIKSGMARVSKPAGSGDMQIDLATLHPGNSFGEIGLIDGLPRSANVTALEPLECYYLPRPVFLTAMKESPEIALGMLPAIAAMVRNADQIAQTFLSMLLKEN
jgi:CRP/FNR family cyclic AMP-dependent transcriptional regulator